MPTQQAVAAIGPQIGSMSIEIPVLANCEELGEKNDQNRQNVADNLTDKKSESGLNKGEGATLRKADTGGMTFSSASSQIPGAPGTFSATSSGPAQSLYPDDMVSGGNSEMKMGLNRAKRDSDDPQFTQAKKDAGVLCDEYVHPGGGKGGHAEPKIINEMTQQFGAEKMTGGSMLLNINWKFMREGAVQTSGMPCADCYALLCHASQKCDIRIYICDKDGNAQPLSNDDCNDEDGYENLCQRVDGNARPGR